MVVKVNKTKNFTVMSNYHFREKNMSLKAKGLLSLMLSLPEDWDYSIEGLTKLSKDGETSVRNALTELEDFHYLKRRRVYKDGKIADWEYHIYEMPQMENLDVENQQLEKQVLENKDNKILNNKKLKNKKNSSINTTVKPLLKKQSLYDKAGVLIRNFTNEKNLQDALFKFLNLQLEIYKEKGRPYYVNIWKSRLAKLQNDFKEEEWLNVVTTATERGWQNFYPLKENGYIVRYNTRLQDIGVTCEQATKEELEENHRRALEREKNGQRGIF